MKSAACCARIADSRSSNHNDRGDSAENRPFWKTLSAFLLTSKHRPPDSCSGALPILEAARTFDSRLRTHHKLWSDWVLWNKRSVTGSERSNCMWLARRPDFGAVSGSIRAQSVPGPEKVNEKGLP